MTPEDRIDSSKEQRMTIEIRKNRDTGRYYALVPAGIHADGSTLTVAAPVTTFDWFLWKFGLGYLVKAKLRRRGVPV